MLVVPSKTTALLFASRKKEVAVHGCDQVTPTFELYLRISYSISTPVYWSGVYRCAERNLVACDKLHCAIGPMMHLDAFPLVARSRATQNRSISGPLLWEKFLGKVEPPD